MVSHITNVLKGHETEEEEKYLFYHSESSDSKTLFNTIEQSFSVVTDCMISNGSNVPSVKLHHNFKVG